MYYECDCCGIEFEYWSRSHHTSKYHFCGRACKVEFHYLRHDLSQSQLNLLAILIERGGHSKIPSDSVALGSLSHHRIAPLINIIHALPASCEVFAEITPNGKRWYKLKQAVD